MARAAAALSPPQRGVLGSKPMVRGSFLLGVLLVPILGCSGLGLGSFEVFCRNSGECACEDGACCAFEGKSCEYLECCDGAVCTAGVCGTAAGLELSPSSLDFGPVTSFPSSAKVVTVTNVSRHSAAVGAVVEGEYELVASDCPQSLPPGASCSIQIRVVGPRISLDLVGSLQVENASPPSVALHAVTGRVVDVDVEGPMTVTSDPAGISCPGKCRGVFPFDATVYLLPSEVPWGHWMHSMDVQCDSATGPCRVNVSTLIHFAARTNLWIQCIGEGSVWLGDERICVTEIVGFGGKPMFGTASVEARPNDPNATIQWYGGCEGATGTVCTREVPTMMIVRFH